MKIPQNKPEDTRGRKQSPKIVHLFTQLYILYGINPFILKIPYALQDKSAFLTHIPGPLSKCKQFINTKGNVSRFVKERRKSNLLLKFKP